MKYVYGIDEAGRGPLAGPVSVGVFGAEKKMEKWLLKNIFENKLRDSKKLSPNKIIDENGISKAVRLGISKSLSPKVLKCKIRLDGLLKAPPKFKNQKTIIKGDEKNVFIACASIVAKVSRDRLMCQLAKKYPKYGFEIHKGYGTVLHRTLIKKYGLSVIHRKTFCKNLTILSK